MDYNIDNNYKMCELIKYHFKQNFMFSKEMINDCIDVTVEFDNICDRYLISMQRSIFGREIEQIKYPSNWVESFKERWFPKFVLKRYPVKYNIHTVREYYPKISMPQKEYYVSFVNGGIDNGI